MNFAVVVENSAALLGAAFGTFGLTIATLLVSIAAAIPMAVARNSSLPWLYWPATAYSWTFRSVPSLTVLFLMYYGLPTVGIYLPAWIAALIGLSLTAVAYMLEIIRAGIRSVPTTQFQTVRALGFPFWIGMRRIIFPQAMRVIVPPMSSQITAVLKGSSLAGLVAVSELTGRAMALISFTYQPIPILIVVAAVYLAGNSLIVLIQHLLERKFSLAPTR